MSLFNTLRVGASGLGTSSMSLAVIGDNIANINTVGYKRSSASFADAIPQAVATLGGAAQLGSGAVNGDVAYSFQQGMLTGSGSPMHMALSGRGFFQVSDGTSNYYTRDGSFDVDQNGYLVTGSGMRVQGYNAVGGDPSSVPGDLRLNQLQLPGQATSELTLRANLDAGSDVGTALADARAAGLDGLSGTTMDEISGMDSVYTTSITVYDSLGEAHDVVLAFEKTDAESNTWTWSALADGGELQLGGSAGEAGQAFEIASGEVSFDGDGELQNFSQVHSNTPWNFTGANAQKISFDLGSSDDGAGKLTQNSDLGSTTFSIAQDGYPMGEMTSQRVDADGKIYGIYSNGQEEVLGQLAVATFASEGALERGGGNLWMETVNSGEPALGVPGEGIRGDLQSYALERANVELEDEFVHMIQAQRAYQANSSVVRTANDTLQQLVNLL